MNWAKIDESSLDRMVCGKTCHRTNVAKGKAAAFVTGRNRPHLEKPLPYFHGDAIQVRQGQEIHM